MARKFRFVLMLKDICFPTAEIDLRQIMVSGGLRKAIEEYVKSGKIIPLTAIQIFNRGKLRGIPDSVRILRSLNVFDVELYFITPIGLIWEEEPLVPYKHCLDELSIDDITKFFQDSKTDEAIYDVLESQPDFLYLYVNTKLIKLLDLVSYIPKDTVCFLVADIGISVKRENIKPLYPSPAILSIFKKYKLKISSDNFPSMMLWYISLVFSRLSREMKPESFLNYLLNIKNNPSEFLNMITSPELLYYVEKARDQSLLRFFDRERKKRGEKDAQKRDNY